MNHVIRKPTSLLVAMGLLVGATTVSALPNQSVWQNPVSKARSQMEVSSTDGITARDEYSATTQDSSSQTTTPKTKRRAFRKTNGVF